MGWKRDLDHEFAPAFRRTFGVEDCPYEANAEVYRKTPDKWTWKARCGFRVIWGKGPLGFAKRMAANSAMFLLSVEAAEYREGVNA